MLFTPSLKLLFEAGQGFKRKDGQLDSFRGVASDFEFAARPASRLRSGKERTL
jgi:hypothetical protein